MTIRRISLPLGLISVAFVAGWSVLNSRAELPATTESKTTKVDRFAKLEKALTGVALVGHSTTTGIDKADGDTKLEPERYELVRVEHLEGDQWQFQARIKYGEHDVTLPLSLPVRWAGDTPVITVDNVGFPGLGTYTARVMIYANHYAGFWSGGDHGGHLFGVIERQPRDVE